MNINNKGASTMIKKYLLIGSLVASGVHYGANGYIKMQDVVVGYARDVTNTKVEELARAWGFQRPIARDEKSIDDLIVMYSEARGINPDLVRAIAKVESNHNQYATSSAGARGLLQVMPQNVKGCGLEHENQLYEVESNIRCGTQVLSEALKSQPDLIMALRYYNGGRKGVGNNPAKETQMYPAKVLNLLAKK